MQEEEEHGRAGVIYNDNLIRNVLLVEAAGMMVGDGEAGGAGSVGGGYSDGNDDDYNDDDR